MSEKFAIDFPDPNHAPDDIDFLAISAHSLDGSQLQINPDIDWPKATVFGSTWDPRVLIAAYSRGLFPMPYEIDGDEIAIGWWSPQPRAIFHPDKIRISQSLMRSMRDFTFSIDVCFSDVVAACGDPSRAQGWINESVKAAYGELHELGLAHSVEVWDQSGELAGGLYGLELGGLFAGESMFHVQRDASKAALVHLAGRLNDGTGRVIDSQWATEHLETLGVSTILRREYLLLLPELISKPATLGQHFQAKS
jgi:leucyl/phenylalanyl-tRNA--protein transferase